MDNDAQQRETPSPTKAETHTENLLGHVERRTEVRSRPQEQRVLACSLLSLLEVDGAIVSSWDQDVRDRTWESRRMLHGFLSGYIEVGR